MPVLPRNYQVLALDAVLEAWRVHTSAVLDMATGTGKTFLFAWLCLLTGGRVLVVAHRDELLEQAADKIRSVCPDAGVAIERADDRAPLATELNLFGDPPRVVVASKDTLSRPKRLKRYPPNEFDVVVIDEAQRAVRKNRSYSAIVEHFCAPPIGTGRAKLLGVSGSLDRHDKEALGGLFETVAYRYLIDQAIDDGYLVPVDVKRAHVEGLSLVSLPFDARSAEDGERELKAAELDRAMRRREYVSGVAAPLLELANHPGRRRRQSVVFSSSGPQAELQAEVLNAESPYSAAVCLGEPYQSADARKSVIEAFRAGRVQHLVTCDLLTEGFDHAGVEIVVLKPCNSRSKVAQMVGRGTRPWPGCVDIFTTAADRRLAIASSPKPVCTVLDPCGVSDRHSLVKVVDIFRGRYTRPDTAVDGQSPGRRSRPPDDAAERQAEREAKRLLESERLRGLRVAVEYTLSDGDMMGRPRERSTPVPRSTLSRPATEPQCRFITARGGRVPPDMTFAQAQAVIAGIRARDAFLPPTPQQVETLNRFGCAPVASRAAAAEMIRRIRDAGWQKPAPPEPSREGDEP